MVDKLEVYKSFNPGDLITAEDANGAQQWVVDGVHSSVTEVENALNAFKEGDINATTLNKKTAEQLKKEFDQRYALQGHSHEGVQRYQRYFLELETLLSGDTLQPAVIMHRMKRHPVVQVYHLDPVPIQGLQRSSREYKFCIAGPEHAQDPQSQEFKTRSSDERHWGDQFNKLIDALISSSDPEKVAKIESKFQDNYTLNAWINNLEKLLFEPGPSAYHFDAGDVYRTPWVAERQDKPVKDLKNTGEWPPRFVYRPRLISGPLSVHGVDFDINVFHLNPNEVEIAPDGSLADFPADVKRELHFMVILRS